MRLIKVENLFFERDDRAIVENVSLELSQDTIMTIVGPNGAGKTTLLKLILGLEKPTRGKIIKDKKVSIGYVPQKLKIHQTLPLTVRNFLDIWGTYTPDEVEVTLEKVGLEGKSDYSMHTLSGGETQRVLIARAILAKPQVLVLDEPIQGVDVNGQNDLYRLILEIKQELKCAVLLVSHDLHLVLKSSDTVVCLNGHICCSGAPEDVKKNSEYTRLFGIDYSDELAPYAHQHDHSHDPITGTCQHGENTDE